MVTNKKIIQSILLKLFQFISSIFMIYCVYNIGPYWIFTFIFLLVPLAGIYIIFRFINDKTESKEHDVLVSQKQWFQVEATTCFTMAIIFSGFGILLIYDFPTCLNNRYLLLAGLSSLFIAFLYATNGFLNINLIQQITANIDENEKCSKRPENTIKSELNKVSEAKIEQIQRDFMPKNDAIHEYAELQKQELITNQNLSSNDQNISDNDQKSIIDQHIVDYIRKGTDQNSDNEINKDNYQKNITHSKNNSKVKLTISSMKGHQNISSTSNNVANFHHLFNQKLSQNSIKKNISKRKVTPIPLIAFEEAEKHNLKKSKDHFSGQFLTTVVSGQTQEPVHFLRYNDGINGSPMQLIHSATNNFNQRNDQEELFVVKNLCKCYDHNIFHQPNVRLMTSRNYGRRKSNGGDQRRCHSKQDSRHRRSGDIQHPSCTYTDSDDEASLPSSAADYTESVKLSLKVSKFVNFIEQTLLLFRSRHKIINTLRDQHLFTDNSSLTTSIVTAIDSGRESEIVRNTFPRQTSSRVKRMKSGGFDVIIRTQTDNKHFNPRRRTQSLSSSSYDKPNDAYFVNKF
ncbi:unnamed protein product [Thelazia callipaeda]|uniref:Transmembrane protein n=1 Tax=Thelazia callipaeda TaxID=103827 RepID=A0A158RBM8_THECL|nr:unnamed protein product [Thelazia callipaeda]